MSKYTIFVWLFKFWTYWFWTVFSASNHSIQYSSHKLPSHFPNYLEGTVITLETIFLVLGSCIFSIWEVVLVWKKENKSKLLACLLPVEKPKGRSPFDKKNVIRKWTLDSTCTIVSRGVKRFIIVILFQIVVPLFFCSKKSFLLGSLELCWKIVLTYTAM